MCIRICLSMDIAEIKKRFGVAGDKTQLRYRPHWNLGAGQAIPVIRYSPNLKARCLDFMRWGLIPAWAKKTMIVCSNLNVRQRDIEPDKFDTIRTASRRCLVPVDNFYEWRMSDKQPFAVALASRQLMALAGVWDRWMSPTGERIDCFAILTTDPNSLLAPLCKRMPAIIFPEDWDLWLGQEPSEAQRIAAMLKPCPDDQLIIWPVDRRLRNVNNDDPKLLETTERL